MNIWEWLQHSYLPLMVRWWLAGTFLFSVVGKLQDRRAFVAVVLDYQVLPARWARHLAALLPWLEGAVGLLLLFGLGVRLAAGLSGALLLGFIIAIGINLARGRKDLKCGCAGARHSPTISSKKLVQNLGLLLLSLLVVRWGQDSPLALYAVSRMFVFVLPAGDGTPLVLALAGALMLVLLVQQLKRFVQMEARR